MLEKLLEYQEIDKELLKLENEFRNSPVVRQRRKLQFEYDRRCEAIKKYSKEIADISNNFAQSEKNFKDALTYEDILNKNLDDISSSKEFAAMEKILLKYEECLNSVENDIVKQTQRIAYLSADSKKIEEQIIVITQELKKVIVIYRDTQRAMLEKAKPIMQKLDALKAGIDEELMKKYLTLRADKKIPFPFVAKYADKSCYACGMEVSVEVGHILSEKGRLIECPNCHRLLYSE